MSGANAHGGTTRTAGVDLAARPTGTASCVLAWTTDGFWIEELACGGVEDPVILELVARDNIGVVGIDVPFGWPEAYVQAVSRHHWGLRPSLDKPTAAPADELRYRQTDRCLMQEVPGTRPLSASLDPLAACVVRATRILGEAESRGYPIDRTGRVGPVAEVYPAASARLWGLDVVLKRRREESRQERLDRLRIALPDALAPAGFTGPTEVFDDPSLNLHAIDALLAALTARAVLGAATRYPHSDEHHLASREGWIHWPAGVVDDLPALPVASDRWAAPPVGRENPMNLVAPLPEAVLRQHEVRVSGEPAWRQHLRLGQALWREERGLAIGSYTPPGEGQTRPLGSRLAMPAAQEQMLNYLTEPIAGVVEAEVAAATSDGRLFSTPRLYDDLLSSQPLCFNLFGELKAEPGYKLATAVTRHLWPHRVREITRIEFEHSPGRDDPTYTGNRSAFDVYLEHTCPDGGHGFIGIEVKYHEDLRGKAAENRPRTKEVAQSSELFADDDLPELRKLPLQQVWFDHLLALSILDAEASWDTGLFVFLHPVINQRCYQVGSRYERLLRDTDSFQRLTLEEFVAVLRLATSAPWVREFHHRYLNHERTASHSTKAHSP